MKPSSKSRCMSALMALSNVNCSCSELSLGAPTRATNFLRVILKRRYHFLSWMTLMFRPKRLLNSMVRALRLQPTWCLKVESCTAQFISSWLTPVCLCGLPAPKETEPGFNVWCHWICFFRICWVVPKSLASFAKFRARIFLTSEFSVQSLNTCFLHASLISSSWMIWCGVLVFAIFINDWWLATHSFCRGLSNPPTVSLQA